MLSDSRHWLEYDSVTLAQEARLLALQLQDPEAKAALLRIAGEYDELAARAAAQMPTSNPLAQRKD
jgi:hypothetical protein